MRYAAMKRNRCVVGLLVLFGCSLLSCSGPREPILQTAANENDLDEEYMDVSSSATTLKDRMLLLLKPRREVAEILLLTAPTEAIDIGRRLKRAAQANPGLFASLAESRDAQGRMVYDPRLGVTEKEYSRFLSIRELMSWTKVDEAPINIELSETNRMRITGLPRLSEVVFDADKLSVTTPFGSLDGCKWSEGKSVGTNEPIAGFSWRNRTALSLLFDEHTFWTAYLAQRADRRVFLELRVKNNATGQDDLCFGAVFPGPRR